MSFPFRTKGSLRDRLRGKSGDEVIKELRDELDQDRKMFFDNPNWGSSPASSAFSATFPRSFDRGGENSAFEDGLMPPGSRRTNIDDHLDKLVARHPELANELHRIRSTGGGGHQVGNSNSNSSSHQIPPQNSEGHQSGSSESTRVTSGLPPKCGRPLGEERSRLRNTVPDMTSQQEDREQRARSAPPQPFIGGGSNDSSSSATSSSSSRHSQQPRVRHIPIYVEGRDELLLPKEAVEEEQHRVGPIPSSPKQAASKEPIPAPPPPVHEPIPAPPPPLQEPIPAPAPPSHEPIPAVAPPTHEPIPVPAPPSHEPIPAPAPPSHEPIPAPAPPSHEPIPAPAPPPHEPIAALPQFSGYEEHNSTQQQVNSAVDVIAGVQQDVVDLKSRVEALPSGTGRKDREYVYLDEMLTRNLLKLDNVDTEGREDLRNLRREAIRTVQRCINILDRKSGSQETTEDTSKTDQGPS